jgi:anti-sigma regulatory factor (Ser/Thr protein kinase)
MSNRKSSDVPDLLLSLTCDDKQARYLREQIRKWGARESLTNLQVDDLMLVASELLSNAVRASDAETCIDVVVSNSPAGVSVRMQNTGLGFDVDSLPAPSLRSFGGRGIAIMRALGAVSVEQDSGETVVTVALRPPQQLTSLLEANGQQV